MQSVRTYVLPSVTGFFHDSITPPFLIVTVMLVPLVVAQRYGSATLVPGETLVYLLWMFNIWMSCTSFTNWFTNRGPNNQQACITRKVARSLP